MKKTIDVNELTSGLEEEILIGHRVAFLEEVEGKKVEKIYRKVADKLFVLVQINDKEGQHELTSIPNFSRYVADLKRGKVFSLRTNRWLNPKPNKRFGYVYTSLINDNGDQIPISLHQIIMSAHKQVVPNDWMQFGLEIDHIDMIKTNNSIDNLRLVRHHEQFCDVVRAKMRGKNNRLSDKDVRMLRLKKAMLEAKDEYVQSDFCNEHSGKLGRSYGVIEKVVNDVTYKHVELYDEQIALINAVSKFDRFEREFNRLKEMVG